MIKPALFATSRLLVLSIITLVSVPAAGYALDPQTCPEYDQAKAAAEQFVAAWLNNDYRAMYAMLSSAAQAQATESQFAADLQGRVLPKLELNYRPLSIPILAKEGKAAIAVDVKSVETLPDPDDPAFIRDFELYLVWENKQAWKIDRLHVPPMPPLVSTTK